ncbi:Pkp1 [Columba guinea]|nr:Pkp1 [Columba guinea]
MLHSPLKTALAYECFQDQASSTLALPSDHKLKTKGTGKQRVQEQVMMTVKRQKQKSSVSSSVGHSNRGSMYDGLADGYGYGTSRGSYYTKTQTGNSSWGYPLYNGTLKRDVENRRYSSYSQMEGWGSKHYSKAVCSPARPGSDYCFVQNIKSSRSEPDLYCEPPRGTLRKTQKAIQLLCSSDDKYQAMGAYYLQHTCFQDESAKQEVYRLGGIAKLVELLRSTNQNVQRAAAGALRNLVFKNPTNKIETRRQNGIRECVSLLRRTGNTEIQKQLTGLLWNLSSTDELKEELIQEALPVLTDCVIIPFSGWSDGSCNRTREIIDPEVFFNATGCLRNLSSADMGRQTMRNYPGLIDSVMTYAQNCVASNRPDDKSVENCICILHNLSYRLDAEVPNRYTQLNHMARSVYMDKTLTGCFNSRSGKMENDEYGVPLPEEDFKPKGPSWLYHSDAIRTYLSLMDQSKKDATLEACAGALQNLTASRGLIYISKQIRINDECFWSSACTLKVSLAVLIPCGLAARALDEGNVDIEMSNAMSQLIGLKEKGLPRIARLLQSNSSDVVRSGASLLSNMSRHPVLHKTMAHQVLPDVSRLLSFQSGNTNSYSEIMTSACYTLRNLIMSNPHLGKSYLTSNMLNNVVSLCRNGWILDERQQRFSSLSDSCGFFSFLEHPN